MVFSLTWLPEVLQSAGLKVAEVPDWRTRGRAEMGLVRGIIVHHTAGSANGNMPSLDLLVRGRPDLKGPLAQLGLGRDGTFYVIAAGRANHAGPGKWSGITTGNSSFIGIECENTGHDSDPWPKVQLEALQRGCAAILGRIKTDGSMVCGHKEYATPPKRKIDPLLDMPAFREEVAALMSAGAPAATPIPASDEQSRPTLRRGAKGAIVAVLQGAIGVQTTGNFGPLTEAKLRAFQREHGLVPDGIAGPATWAAFDLQQQHDAPEVAAPVGGGEAGAKIVVAASVAAAPTTTATAAVTTTVVLPLADDARHTVRVDGVHALSPDGKPFVSKFRLGFVTTGQTSIAAFLRDDPGAANALSRSAVRAVSAVTANEGRLEAVNSWDGAFLSFGIMQWTAGVAGDPGELAALLARVRAADAEVFKECFGRFGLDLAIGPGALTGRLTIGGAALANSRDKAPLRTAQWAYRFWRAGHHPLVRRCQLAHAAARIDRFSGIKVRGHPIREWLSSELGMAQVLDQHVNRPGHVPDTLDRALGALISAGSLGPDPAGWKQADEQKLIERYLALRAKTSMTSSQARANRLFDLARTGSLDIARGSFS